jgi:predicted transposase YdaD
MSKPFDATFKHLLENYPADWLRISGLTAQGTIEIVDADLATITAESDKLLRVNDPTPWMLHLEAQSSYDVGLPGRVHAYNTLAHRRHGLLVRSVAVLLRKEASGRAINGIYRLKFAEEKHHYLEFRYHVVRVWELPCDDILASGLGTLPLALLADDAGSRMSEVLERMQGRVSDELPKPEAARLLTAAYVLAGLRYSRDATNMLFEGIHSMEESDTYQFIVEQGLVKGWVKGRAEGHAEGRTEGRAEGQVEMARTLVRKLGMRRLGPPSEQIVARLGRIRDQQLLEDLAERVVEASSWEELLPEEKANGETSGAT